MPRQPIPSAIYGFPLKEETLPFRGKNKSLKELLDLKHYLCDAEIKIKTGQTQDPEYLLESVILRGGNV